ncbi:MAG: glycosyltransferase family 2 protein [Phycisphaerae bacterium]|nr:glycosyltransferase family 2 protein [Phycisphaerae bacterium]MDD5381525.1 glycosyltransferase family 2 protein [Phycisphaerae bacterium]
MIDILLATYNGEKYLTQQIDSIVAQTYKDWQLLIRDDLSTDNTVNIIKNYTRRCPDKIRLIEDSKGHLGLVRNFEALLESSQSEFIMFCDQDDIWLPNKIELTLNAMEAAGKTQPNTPLLIHTDLKVVDETLTPIAESFWKLHRISPENDCQLKKIIYRNIVTGCTVMINKKAKEISMPFSPEARIHDWWIALNVVKNGKIIHVTTTTVLYRQHTANIIGAKKPLKEDMLLLPQKFIRAKRFLLSDYRMAKKIVPDISLAQWLLKNIALSFGRRFRL